MAFDPIPVPVRGSPTFNADAEAFAQGISQFAQDYNTLSSVLDGALTSSSTTSLAISTGSKTLTVQTGLGYIVGYPIRIASTVDPTDNMDGVVTAYNDVTGSLTVDVLSASGSGTLASWNTMVLPGGGNVASLSYNKFTGRQVFANEVTLSSASTLDFTTGDSNQFYITGTTTITAATIDQGSVVKARFASSCQLTHGTNFQIQGGVNYTTAAGDIATFTSNGTVVRVEISPANGRPVNLPVLNETNDPTFLSTSSTDATSPGWVKGLLPGFIKSLFNVGGSAPMFACRAWVNFNGGGTPSIRSSGNVSSITKNGTGDYTINFTTNMPDANYSLSVAYGNGSLSGAYSIHAPFGTPTSSVVRVACATVATPPVLTDASYINVQIFR